MILEKTKTNKKKLKFIEVLPYSISFQYFFACSSLKFTHDRVDFLSKVLQMP